MGFVERVVVEMVNGDGEGAGWVEKRGVGVLGLDCVCMEEVAAGDCVTLLRVNRIPRYKFCAVQKLTLALLSMKLIGCDAFVKVINPIRDQKTRSFVIIVVDH